MVRLSIERIFLLFFIGFLFSSPLVFSQVGIHRYSLGEVSYEYIQATPKRERCLEWGILEDSKPALEYTREGTFFTRVRIKATIKPGCSISVAPKDRVTISSSGSQRVFEFVVLPPVSTYLVRSGGIVDKVVIEAPSKKLKEVSFFDFFNRSQIFFETRLSRFKTDNESLGDADRNRVLFPIIGGRINVPSPVSDYLYFGLEMYQNINNVASRAATSLNYSEASLDIRLQYTGGERQGRTMLAALASYRARNIVQTSVLNPFSLNYVSSWGGGIDAMSFFPPDWMRTDSILSKFGLEASFRYETSGNNYSSFSYSAGLLYRTTSRFAISSGYSSIAYSISGSNITSAGQSKINESINGFYFRLHLMPYLVEKGGR